MRKRQVLFLILLQLPLFCRGQNQQVTMYNPNTGDYSYGTIQNPPPQNRGPGLIPTLLNFSRESDELEWKQKAAAQQQAAAKASQKRAAERAKQDAEMRSLCQRQALRVCALFDTIKGVQPWDEESLKFKKEIQSLIAEDPYQAGLVLIELDSKMRPAAQEAEQKRKNEEYQKHIEANRPKGIGERLKNAFNALLSKEPTTQATSQNPPQTSQFDPTQPYEIVSDPYQQILDEEAKGLNKKK